MATSTPMPTLMPMPMPTPDPRAVGVLLTCCGWKTYLGPTLRAARRLGRLVAADADPRSPITDHVDAFHAVPSVSDAESYVGALLEIAEAEGSRLVLPQNDVDLLVLAEAAPRFAEHGVTVAGADAETTRIVLDKLAMGPWLADRGFASPRTVLPTEASRLMAPVVVKARRGQGGAGLRRLHHADDIAGLGNEADSELVAQEWIDGEEFHLDILRHGDGPVLSVVAKRKLAMRWGSTDQAEPVTDRALERSLVDLGARLGEAVGATGSIDVDVLASPDGSLHVLDINPRIGGGFPFTVHWVPDYLDALLALGAEGEAPEPFLDRPVEGRPMYREVAFREFRRRP